MAEPIAQALGAPLDVWVARKIGVPFQRELGIGAIAEGGGFYLDRPAMEALGLSETEVVQIAEHELVELERRVRLYRGTSPRPAVTGRTVIVVDDGIATGGTARATARALDALRPARTILAVGVAATQSLPALQAEYDQVVAVHATPELEAVGRWYADFEQVTDAEVVAALDRARRASGLGRPGLGHR